MRGGGRSSLGPHRAGEVSIDVWFGLVWLYWTYDHVIMAGVVDDLRLLCSALGVATLIDDVPFRLLLYQIFRNLETLILTAKYFDRADFTCRKPFC